MHHLFNGVNIKNSTVLYSKLGLCFCDLCRLFFFTIIIHTHAHRPKLAGEAVNSLTLEFGQNDIEYTVFVLFCCFPKLIELTVLPSCELCL